MSQRRQLGGIAQRAAEDAATVLQARLRGWQARQRCSLSKDATMSAVAAIQARARGRLARQALRRRATAKAAQVSSLACACPPTLDTMTCHRAMAYEDGIVASAPPLLTSLHQLMICCRRGGPGSAGGGVWRAACGVRRVACGVFVLCR